MLSWTLKSMWERRNGTLASAGSVAGAFLLVVLLEAVFLGESKQIVAYIEHTKPDVWVMQHGVSSMHMASSFLWDWKADRVAELPGVESASPILYVNTMMRAGDRDWFAYILGLRPNDARAGPWAMVAGKALPGRGEIVIPSLLARIADVGLGDVVSIADSEFSVVGLSTGTFSMANSVAFVPFEDLERILSARGTVSYVLVDAMGIGRTSCVLAWRPSTGAMSIPYGSPRRGDFKLRAPHEDRCTRDRLSLAVWPAGRGRRWAFGTSGACS